MKPPALTGHKVLPAEVGALAIYHIHQNEFFEQKIDFFGSNASVI